MVEQVLPYVVCLVQCEVPPRDKLWVINQLLSGCDGVQVLSAHMQQLD